MTVQEAEALTLTVERVIRADRERVFAAWTRPELLQKWSAPKGMTIESGSSLDLRVGGHWNVVMLEPNGTRHEAFGTYREVTPPERLVYTHAWRRDEGGSSPETLLTVEFHAEAGATRVVLTQTGFGSPQSRDGHSVGWNSALDNLEELFAGEAS